MDMRHKALWSAAVAVAALVLAVSPAGAWQPPTGIPTPPFGITEVAGPFTHYVDNTHAAATDSSNANGSPSKPRLTVPTALAAGSVVEVRGGPYTIPNGRTWTGNGTAAAPVFIKGVGSPVFQDTGEKSTINFSGSYFIVEGVVFNNKALSTSGATNFTLRGSVVRNYSPGSNSSAIGAGGTNNVIYNNEIHNNGESEGAAEIDIHGIKVTGGASYLWIVDNHIHHNGGDSIQLGDAQTSGTCGTWPQYIYIGRNQMHRDRENAVDVKKACDVIVSQNTMYDYVARDTSAGDAIVSHDGAKRVWVIFNEVYDVDMGVGTTGTEGFYVVGNIIRDVDAPGANTSSFYSSGTAIYARASTGVQIVNNTIWRARMGVSYQSGAGADFTVVNNIIDTLGGFRVGLNSSSGLSGSTINNNLYGGAFSNRVGSTNYSSLSSWQGTGKDTAGLNQPPQFVNEAANNYRLGSASPAVNKGTTHSVYQKFFDLYGRSIAVDREGVARPFGPAWDMGAYEWSGVTADPPEPPMGLVVRP